MKFTKRAMILFISILTLAVTTITACGFLGIGSTEKWKEEVKLSDGRVIIVDRKTIREGGGAEIVLNPSGTKPKEYHIRFADPNGSGKIIEWCSTKKDDRTWPEIPLILDIESGSPIVYAIVSIDIACEIYSKYIYRNGVWSEESLPKKFEKLTTNLSIALGVDMPKYINLETKRKENAEIGYRQSLKQVGPNRQVCG